jgi:hypothetical protein
LVRPYYGCRTWAEKNIKKFPDSPDHAMSEQKFYAISEFPNGA